MRRLYGSDQVGYFKDAFHDYLIDEQVGAVNPALTIYAWGLRLGDHPGRRA